MQRDKEVFLLECITDQCIFCHIVRFDITLTKIDFPLPRAVVFTICIGVGPARLASGPFSLLQSASMGPLACELLHNGTCGGIDGSGQERQLRHMAWLDVQGRINVPLHSHRRGCSRLARAGARRFVHAVRPHLPGSDCCRRYSSD
eukprot:scaffold1903_cov396-Prasinococcus_capsulatus_cf.AAC.19